MDLSKFAKTFSISALNDARDRLQKKERGSAPFRGPQWVLWAAYATHRKKFKKLLSVLKSLRGGSSITRSELSLLLDALAFGYTNVTPERLDWAFAYSPHEIRNNLAEILDAQDPEGSIELAVLATSPFDPSDDLYYDDLWRGFNAAYLKKEGAYDWIAPKFKTWMS